MMHDWRTRGQASCGVLWSRIRPGAVLLLFLFTVTALCDVILPSYRQYIYCVALLAAVGAMALNLLMGTVGQVSLGTAGFLAAGAFSAVFLIRSGVPTPLVFLGAAAVTGAVGFVVGLPALRVRGLYLGLTTLAAFFVIEYGVTRYQRSTVGVSGFSVQPLFSSEGINGSVTYWMWLLAIIVALVFLVCLALSRGKTGRAFRMIRDNETAAHALGINVTAYKLGVFVFSSSILGVQGALTVYFTGYLDSGDFTLALSISYLAMIIIGGLDSVVGAIIGAVIIIVLPNVAPTLVGLVGVHSSQGPAIAEVLYGLMVVVIVVAAPGGIAAGANRGIAFLKQAAGRSRWRRHGPMPSGPSADPGRQTFEPGSIAR